MSVALVIGGLPAAAYADGSQSAVQNNWAIVHNYASGQTGTRLAFSVWGAVKNNAITTNRAEAVNSECSSCASYAAAFSVSLITATRVTADNSSVAVNDQCVNCIAAAVADQFVVVTNVPLTLTQDALSQLAGVRTDLQNLLADPQLTPDEFEAQTDALEGAVVNALATGLTEGRVTGQISLDGRVDDSRGNHRHTSTTRTVVVPPGPTTANG